jgi:hypothetical protein
LAIGCRTSAPATRVAIDLPVSKCGMAASMSGVVPSIASCSAFALSGLADFHAPKVFSHSPYLPMRALLWSAKYLYVSPETNHLSAGRPRPSRAESAY